MVPDEFAEHLKLINTAGRLPLRHTMPIKLACSANSAEFCGFHFHQYFFQLPNKKGRTRYLPIRPQGHKKSRTRKPGTAFHK
jgi:hypothetical protein